MVAVKRAPGVVRGIAALAVIFVFFPAVIGAQQEAGSPVVPLNPQVPRVVGEQTSVAGMLEGIFTLSIAAAGILAAIMIAIAGIQYMGTDAYSSKEQAKDRIRGAVLGLLIIFSAVLFLRVINPDLVSIRFALQNISIKPDDWAPPGFGIGNEKKEPVDAAKQTSVDVVLEGENARSFDGTNINNLKQNGFSLSCSGDVEKSCCKKTPTFSYARGNGKIINMRGSLGKETFNQKIGRWSCDYQVSTIE